MSSSSEHPILGQLALGYSPMIDPQRNVVATRLTVFPARADAQLDAGQLLAAVADVWPEGGRSVSLNVVSSEALLAELMNAEPAKNVMIEVPAFIAGQPEHIDALRQLKARGNTLLIKGRPITPLPPEVLPCFRWSIVELSEDRRVGEVAPPPGVTRSIATVQAGVRTLAEMESSFKRGAAAVLGWPIDDVVAKDAKPGARSDLAVMVELIKQVDRGDDIEKLENTLKREPTLAFKLLRYINSPLFGLRVEVSSFRHAIMLLGYTKLKRWLALLLATGSKDQNLRPVMYAAVRRGLLLEELARDAGDAEMRSEIFICGVFSLLDRMFAQPFSELLTSLPVPERVRHALVDETGPFVPFLQLVRAIESESVYDIRECADALLMDAREINGAVLRALAGASQLE
jgi:EAL and modified HD-GYP domain-containing signal transduction protein